MGDRWQRIFLWDWLSGWQSSCTRVRMPQIEIYKGGPLWNNGELTGPLHVTRNLSLVSRLLGKGGTMIGNLMSKPYVLGKLNNLNGKRIWKRIDICLCKTGSLCCTLETNTHCKSTQFSSVIQSCPTLCDLMNHSMPGFLSITNSRSLIKLMYMESVMPSNHLILCPPLLLPPSIISSIRVFSSELVLHIRWPKHWSFSFSISPSNEYSGLISFRIDWFDILALQGTLKSPLQHHSSKASILRGSGFFRV